MRFIPLFFVASFFVTCLAVPLYAAVNAQETLPPVEEVAVEVEPTYAAFQKIQSFMEEVRTLRADFIQRSPGGNVASGTLSLERPGRIRFDYSDDTPFLIVSDGKTLNFIDEEIEEVTKWPVKDTPLRVLLGSAVDLASYGARVEVAPGGIEGLIALHATDKARPELGEITIYFREDASAVAGLRLASWKVIDAQGALTVVEVEDTDVNIEFASKLWTFEDPRGLAKRRGVRR